MNYYVYFLECCDGKRYYGHTNDLDRRIKEHFSGKVEATRLRRPLKLIYFQVLSSRSEAFKQEMKFKNGKTRKETIGKLIKEFSKEKCQGFNSRI